MDSSISFPNTWNSLAHTVRDPPLSLLRSSATNLKVNYLVTLYGQHL